MTDKLDDVWNTRDYPVLREVVRRVDQGTAPVNARELVAVTNLEEDDIRRAFAALERRGLLLDAVRVMDNRPGPTAVCNVSGPAYLITGLHPDGDDAFSRLIDALKQAAEQTTDPEEKSRIRRAIDGLVGMSRDIGVSVATAVLSGQVS